MARKRMFSLDVVDTDLFLDMPTSAQALYFHLGMHGDDDGFVSSPRKILAAAGCKLDDLKLLAAKGFVIVFDSGICVVTDWKLNNTLKNDRYKPTLFIAEKTQINEGNNGKYQLGSMLEPDWNQNGNSLEPQLNLTKHNEERDLEDKPPPTPRFVPPTVEEVEAYCAERGNGVDPNRFVDHYITNGWVQGKGKPIKDWRAAVRTWEKNSQQVGAKATAGAEWRTL